MGLAGRKITVLGAGVAGLAVSRALALRGAEVTVLEQAAELDDIGAGLQISPNGAAVLRGLGLDAAFTAAGLAAEAVELRDGRDDRLVTRLDLARLRPGQDYRFLHRADLIALLAEGARDAGVNLRLLQKVERVELVSGGPVLHSAQGAELRPGLVIGADGLHSVLHRALHGVIAPQFTMQTAWRAVIPCQPGAPPVAEVHMGPRRHLVSYPLRGGRLRNIVAVEERHRWVEESWSLKDDALEMRFAFEGFSPRVRGWLEQAEECWLWGLFVHPVARHWYWAEGGRGAALLGDAAHPTLPFLAQGANMALEDAWVLAAMLDRHDDLAAALAGYQAARADRCARIVAAAAGNARAYHLRGPLRDMAHLGLRLAGRLAPAAMLGRFDWIYGHDVTARTP